MIIYAHRGASSYAPENTISAFYMGLLQGANGIETDIQMSKDGIAVLFHDDTLQRVAGIDGRICDYNLHELKEFKVVGNAPENFFDRIVTLEEFLKIFSQYNLKFALELKASGTEKAVLALANKYRIINNVTITSFDYELISNIRKMCDYIRIGWLVDSDGVNEIQKLKDISGEEMCPKASAMTQASVKALRDAGLGIRAWGVKDTVLMKRMCELNVDGMTVNFPDKLSKHLASIK